MKKNKHEWIIFKKKRRRNNRMKTCLENKNKNSLSQKTKKIFPAHKLYLPTLNLKPDYEFNLLDQIYNNENNKSW